MDAHSRHGVFGTTEWGVVLEAAGGLSAEAGSTAREALESLCRIYWRPVYACIRARAGAAGEAEDLTQEFFHRLLHGQYLAQMDPSKGRFRSFLAVAIEHFLCNARDRARAVKRGGRVLFLSLDQLNNEAGLEHEPASHETPERIYERRWAASFLSAALERLRQESVAEGNGDSFEFLKPYLTAKGATEDYAQLSRQLGTTEAGIKMRITRLRQRYREAVRAEAARIVDHPGAVDDELRHLLRVFSE